jgi:hypothetical protein
MIFRAMSLEDSHLGTTDQAIRFHFRFAASFLARFDRFAGRVDSSGQVAQRRQAGGTVGRQGRLFRRLRGGGCTRRSHT